MTRRSSLPAAAARLLDWRVLLSLFFVLTLALTPSLAEARAGGKSSFGSRGSRTFEQNNAAPITRSANPASQAASPASGMAGAAAANRGGFFARNPLLFGLAGGFLGAMLFSSLGGFGTALGGILQFLIIGLLIFLAVRLAMHFFGNRGTPATAGARGGFGGGPMPQPMPRAVGAAVAPAPRFRGVDTTVGDSDLQAFQELHAAVQEAWSNSDLARMRQLMTPEMVGYFSEELTKNASRGVRNIVSNVELLAGDISESWEEGDLQYATAYMKWSATDYLARLDRSPGAPD
ncbi:MAG TPA: TIM44-like domain-containing protein, partial [Stellaceae bacterium]|nr:TIM44-like domain-containing protein [Stellaceae bacterium]